MNKSKWNIVKKIVKAYSSDSIEKLFYKKYKTLDWKHIKNIT
jgi:hypothetical protein